MKTVLDQESTVKEKTHRPGGFFSERSEEVELPAAGAKILKIVLCTWKLVRGLNARQNPCQKKKRRSLSLSLFSLLFSSFLPLSLCLSFLCCCTSILLVISLLSFVYCPPSLSPSLSLSSPPPMPITSLRTFDKERTFDSSQSCMTGLGS